MTIHRLQKLHLGANPDTTGECWFEPSSILNTNDVFPYPILRFGASNAAQPSVRHGCSIIFEVPQNYVGTPILRIKWTSTLTSGNVVWDADYRTLSGDDTTSLDQSGNEASVTVTDAAPTAALRQLVATINLTGSHFSAGETVQLNLFRDGTDAADTLAGSAILHDFTFEYSDA